MLSATRFLVFSRDSSSALFWPLIHITQGPLTILARDSEIDSEVDARFALSLHVFVSRLFGWTLLEGAVRGARCSQKKNSSKFVKISHEIGFYSDE